MCTITDGHIEVSTQLQTHTYTEEHTQCHGIKSRQAALDAPRLHNLWWVSVSIWPVFDDVGGNFQPVIHACAKSWLRDTHFFNISATQCAGEKPFWPSAVYLLLVIYILFSEIINSHIRPSKACTTYDACWESVTWTNEQRPIRHGCWFSVTRAVKTSVLPYKQGFWLNVYIKNVI